MRGRFTPEANAEEWCERRLLSRIHHYTLKRLRAEIEPVGARDFLRFLLDWNMCPLMPGVAGPKALRPCGGATRRLRGCGGRVGKRDFGGATRRL